MTETSDDADGTDDAGGIDGTDDGSGDPPDVAEEPGNAGGAVVEREAAGVVVAKRVGGGTPTVGFEIRAAAEGARSVRIVDSLPEGVDADDLRFDDEFGEGWSRGRRGVEFRTVLGPGDEVTTGYDPPAGVDPAAFAGEPRIDVSDLSAGGSGSLLDRLTSFLTGGSSGTEPDAAEGAGDDAIPPGLDAAVGADVDDAAGGERDDDAAVGADVDDAARGERDDDGARSERDEPAPTGSRAPAPRPTGADLPPAVRETTAVEPVTTAPPPRSVDADASPAVRETEAGTTAVEPVTTAPSPRSTTGGEPAVRPREPADPDAGDDGTAEADPDDGTVEADPDDGTVEGATFEEFAAAAGRDPDPGSGSGPDPASDPDPASATADLPAALRGADTVGEALVREVEAGRLDADDVETLTAATSGRLDGAAEARVERLERQVAELSAYAEALESFLVDPGTAEAIRADLDEIRATVAGLTDRLDATDDDVADLREAVARLDGRVERLTAGAEDPDPSDRDGADAGTDGR